MGEFASNGKANAGLTTGIIGTTLGGLWALGAGNGGNGGLLSGLFGGGNANLVSGLMAENGMLKSENYADKIGKERAKTTPTRSARRFTRRASPTIEPRSSASMRFWRRRLRRSPRTRRRSQC